MFSDSHTPSIPEHSAEQIRRARVLLGQAELTSDPDTQFVLSVGALHLARSVPEHWYTAAEPIAIQTNVEGRALQELTVRLRTGFESIFSQARRYGLLTELRRWDFHWEPLRDPQTLPPTGIYGRGAPMRLSTGPNANSAVVYRGGNLVETTGSGKRVGRSNYYQVTQQRFVDAEASEALPLPLALSEFLDDLPACIAQIQGVAEVEAYIRSQPRWPTGTY